MDIVFGLVSLFLIAYILSTLTNTGFQFYIVRSSSMKPVTVAGDVAIIRRLNKHITIQNGDIIAFRSPVNQENIFIHRVIETTPSGYITKGDANEDQDARPITNDKVLGTYIFRIPFLGFLFEGLRRVINLLFRDNYWGWPLLIFIPALIWINSRKKDET
jgi:signal peptidase